MTIFERLEQWKTSGMITERQYELLTGRVRGEPFSVFLELNVLLYLGVLAFAGGLGWTITTYSKQLGDLLILTLLALLFSVCFWYCFRRASPWSPEQTFPPSLVFDYVLYLGSLTWSIAFAYAENRMHLLSGQWDGYLLATAVLYAFLAYRFDNRFVLTLALSSLAGWFGVTISHWKVNQDALYRQYGILYSVVVGVSAALLYRLRCKPHFLSTSLHVAANVLFWALLSGVFLPKGYGFWLLGTLLAAAASISWGIRRREFSFVAFASVYAYLGLCRWIAENINSNNLTPQILLFTVTGIILLFVLVSIARNFGSEE